MNVNAFIKVRWMQKDKRKVRPVPRLLQQNSSSSASQSIPEPNRATGFPEPVSRLPPDFGSVSKLDALDHDLFRFCKRLR